MAVPDLPPELWLEILAYLPRTFIQKVLGINRFLFSLAMRDKYEEVRLITDDKELFRSLEQIRHKNIGSLVRRLHIRPAFLPAMDDVFQPDEERIDLRNFFEVTKRFPWIRRAKSESQLHNATEDSTLVKKTLSAVSKSFSNCPNLREVVIIIYDHALTADFKHFLDDLWRFMGDRLSRLTISTTLNKVPELLDVIGQNAAQLSILESLDITIVNSRFPREKNTVKLATSSTVSLVHRFKDTLSHLTISSSISFDHDLVFEQLGTLPKLDKLELRFMFCKDTLPSGGKYLNSFLAANSNTLKHIIAIPRPRFEVFQPNAGDLVFDDWVRMHVPRLKLPKVHTIELGLRQRTFSFIDPDESQAMIIPPLPPIFPRLTTFIAGPTTLSFSELNGLLEQTGPQLEGLEIRVWRFTPSVLALLVAKLPRLTRLSLTYEQHGHDEATSTTHAHNINLVTSPNGVTAVTTPTSIYLALQAARYRDWTLRHLRIGSKHYKCGMCHPDSYMSELIREAVSMDLVVDVELHCECDGKIKVGAW